VINFVHITQKALRDNRPGKAAGVEGLTGLPHSLTLRWGMNEFLDAARKASGIILVGEQEGVTVSLTK
jgi:hypothetical protein